MELTRALTARRPEAAAAVAIALGVIAVAAVGGIATDTGSPWYRALDVPSFQPPGWVFAPVWTVLYVLLAWSFWLAWRDVGGRRRDAVLALYALNLQLNLAWTLIFFQAHDASFAAVEIVALLATILALIALVWRDSRTAALALVPYAVWVSLATAITWWIAANN